MVLEKCGFSVCVCADGEKIQCICVLKYTNFFEVNMRLITEIIIHATATRPDWWAGRHIADKVAEIRRWQVQVS